MSKALEDISAERQRQVTQEGWTPEHDDGHGQGEMARAAACYAYLGTLADNEIGFHRDALYGIVRGAISIVSIMWPWSPQWLKTKGDNRRMLVKAGALIVAEIERMDREGERDAAETQRIAQAT